MPDFGRSSLRDLRRPTAVLLWAVALFVGAELAVFAAREHFWPSLRDPEYGRKLSLLQARLAEAPPGRPLLLAVGSSRVSMGLSPGSLTAGRDHPDGAPVVFNWGLCAATPVHQVLYLRQLLAAGIRPDAVVIELWPMWFFGDFERVPVEDFDPSRLAWQDLEVLQRYVDDPKTLSRRWCEAQLLPCWSHRSTWVNLAAPVLAPSSMRREHVWTPLDPWGWLAIPGWTTPGAVDAARARREPRRAAFADCVSDFVLHRTNDRALRELLTLCHRHGIRTGLLLTPEHSEFRAAYSSAGRAAVEEHLRRLGREHGVPLIDAREWVGDEGFFEGVHLTHEGAAAFTAWFDREVVRRWLDDPSWLAVPETP